MVLVNQHGLGLRLGWVSHLLDNRDFGYRHVSFFIVVVAHDGGAAWLGCLDFDGLVAG